MKPIFASLAFVFSLSAACAPQPAVPTAEPRPQTVSVTVPAATATATTTAPTAAPQPGLSPTQTSAPYAGPMLIGFSNEGRPLEVYRFGRGPERRMIAAGIHGGYEWNTIALANELIDLLREKPELVPPNITLFVLPAFNPDGEANSHGYAGRANQNGVDLNRNFPIEWLRDWPKAGCWDYLPIFGGENPASEPETQAIMQFVLANHITALISYHSAALGIFPGGDPADPASLRLAEEIAAVTDYPFPGLNSGCFYSGTFTDWAASNGVAAVDVELHNHSETDYEMNVRVLLAFLSWQRNEEGIPPLGQR